VRQALLPVVRDQAAFADSIDVVGQRQRDDVGLQAVDDRTRLLAGAAVRLLDGDVVAGLGLPLAREGLVEVLVQLARRVVGHVQQGDVGGEGGGLGQSRPVASAAASLVAILLLKHRYLFR
jgi:hypothetical protein